MDSGQADMATNINGFGFVNNITQRRWRVRSVEKLGIIDVT